MTEEENAILRQIADAEVRILEQQRRIQRLKAEHQPLGSAEELLFALMDGLRARRMALDAIRRLTEIGRSSP